MTIDLSTAIENAIAALHAQKAPARGRREVLAQYANDLRSLRDSGWNQTEILGALRTAGALISRRTLSETLADASSGQKKSMTVKVKEKPNVKRITISVEAEARDTNDLQTSTDAPQAQSGPVESGNGLPLELE